MIVARAVTKRFGRIAAVDDVSFELAPGQAVALWGSNGAGKTTLIRCLLGVIRFKGSISVSGADTRRAGKRARAHIGYVPQELAFHDDTRVGSAMRFFSDLRRADPGRCGVLLEQVGLSGHERKRVRDLSGGMKQRLALAVAMLSDPPVIVLDEPTSNLDAAGRAEVVDSLSGLKDQGKTILFASHRPDEVIALADRVLVMDSGRLVRDTTPEDLWSSASAVRTLRLHLFSGAEDAAAALLRERGHSVNLNGHGLCVSVPRDQKAVPIRQLAEGKIQVRDFEILDDITTQESEP